MSSTLGQHQNLLMKRFTSPASSSPRLHGLQSLSAAAATSASCPQRSAGVANVIMLCIPAGRAAVAGARQPGQ